MKKRKYSNPDADLDEEIDDYEPSDSDDDYDDNEKLLLEKARKGKCLNEEDDDDDDDSDNEEDVLGVYSSDEEGSADGKLQNNDSDIEGMEDDRLPDSKAWGKRKRDYYHTDYVDQDFGGFAREEEETAAMMEEKEARTLQSRLAAQLDDVDLSLGLAAKNKKSGGDDEPIGEDVSTVSGADDVVKTDLSKLTKREKLALFEKESPEFYGLVKDYNERLGFARDKLFPVLNLIESGYIPKSLTCSKLVNLKAHLTMNYCINLVFYLLLKKKRIQIKHHPVTERLLTYRNLLQQLDSVETPEYIEELNTIVNRVNDSTIGSLFPAPKGVKVKTKSSGSKKKLKLLSKSDDHNVKKRKTESNESANNGISVDVEGDHNTLFDNGLENYGDLDDGSDGSSADEMSLKKELTTGLADEENGKRAITYMMAKNKGLTPHRKKEQRNPRVKNRNKYRKALIKRKGQVRGAQTELKKYGGEVFGIKASVIKSRKIK